MTKKKNRKYINYDYEELYREEVNQEDKRIKELLDAGELKSAYCTKTIKAGKQFEVEIYPEFTRKEADKLKIKKASTTAQKNLNDKNARKRLERLINANFGSGDYWATFTYSPGSTPESIEEAQKDMKNYIARVNYRRRKEGLEPAKYIYITEQGTRGRIHHHLIIDKGLPMDVIEAIWTKGKRNNVRRIAEDENGLTGLANYLSKDPNGRKRWKSSKGLKKPTETKSYSKFKFKKIRKMIENHNLIAEELEKAYKNKRFLNAEVRYNEHNGRFYIYARMIQENTRGNT